MTEFDETLLNGENLIEKTGVAAQETTNKIEAGQNQAENAPIEQPSSDDGGGFYEEPLKKEDTPLEQNPAEQKPEELKIPEGKVLVGKDDVDELQYLRSVVARLETDFEAGVKEFFGRDLSAPTKSYEQEYEEGVEAIRKKFGDDFEVIPSDIANPRSDTAKYLAEVNALQIHLLEKQRSQSQRSAGGIEDQKKIFLEGKKAIEETVSQGVKEFGIKEQDLKPFFDEAAGVQNNKFLLAKLGLKYYIEAKFGLQNKALKTKIEEKIAAETKASLTPTPTGQKSRNRSELITPFEEEEPMFQNF